MENGMKIILEVLAKETSKPLRSQQLLQPRARLASAFPRHPENRVRNPFLEKNKEMSK